MYVHNVLTQSLSCCAQGLVKNLALKNSFGESHSALFNVLIRNMGRQAPRRRSLVCVLLWKMFAFFI